MAQVPPGLPILTGVGRFVDLVGTVDSTAHAAFSVVGNSTMSFTPNWDPSAVITPNDARHSVAYMTKLNDGSLSNWFRGDPLSPPGFLQGYLAMCMYYPSC